MKDWHLVNKDIKNTIEVSNIADAKPDATATTAKDSE